VRLAEAPSHGRPIAAYAPESRGAIAYRALATELWGRLEHDAGRADGERSEVAVPPGSPATPVTPATPDRSFALAGPRQPNRVVSGAGVPGGPA
jgi:hypothetical protein